MHKIMNTTQIIDRFGTAPFRAEIAIAPHNSVSQLARRARESLRLRDRFRYAPRAIVVAVVAIACLFAGLLSHSDLLVLIGCLGLPVTLYFVLRFSPEQIERQVAQTEADCERVVPQYDSQCQVATEKFATTAHIAIQRENKLAVQSGSSLAEIAAFKGEIKTAFLAMEAQSAEELAARLSQVKACRDGLQRKRSHLSTVCRNPKAKLFPGPARRAGTDVLAALAMLSAARIDESVVKAEVLAFKRIGELTDQLPQASPLGGQVGTALLAELPVWLGTQLPSRQILEVEAKKLVDANIKTIRSKLVEMGDGEAPGKIVQQEIDRLFQGRLPGPNSIEDCIGQLNGDGRNWADRLMKEGSPLARLNPFPDKTRHKKVFLLTAAASESAAYRNLHEALPEQSTALVARDHPPTELLCLVVEECTTYAEYPEIVNLPSEVRALSAEEFVALATVCAPQCLREFFPERTEQDCSPAPLLAGALTFGVIIRSGAQNYSYDGQILAKGFRATMDALKDSRLAAPIADRVMRQVSAEGLTSAVAKLNEAKKRTTSFVPKEFASEFCRAIDDADAHLSRRAATAAAVS